MSRFFTIAFATAAITLAPAAFDQAKRAATGDQAAAAPFMALTLAVASSGVMAAASIADGMTAARRRRV